MKEYIKPEMVVTPIDVPHNILWNSVPDYGPGWEEDDAKERDWGEVDSTLWN